MMYKKIIDISVPLDEKTVIYPSNPLIEIEELKSAAGNVISKITFGSHTGTHIDAPSHCIPGTKTLDEIDVAVFVGHARVLDLTESKGSVSAEELKRKGIKKGERVLLKTSNSQRGFTEFHPDFVFLSPEGAQYLADAGVILVGIDSLSIKQKGSPDNTPHTNLLSKDIPIIEGLDLSQCEEGEYFLIAPPLRFTGLDGSPTRALLLQ